MYFWSVWKWSKQCPQCPFQLPLVCAHVLLLAAPQGSSISPWDSHVPLTQGDECLLLSTFVPGLGLYLGCPHTSISLLKAVWSPTCCPLLLKVVQLGSQGPGGTGKLDGDALSLLCPLPEPPALSAPDTNTPPGNRINPNSSTQQQNWP